MIDSQNPSLSYVECFRDFEISSTLKIDLGVNLYQLAGLLKNYGFQLEGRAISYYSSECEMYVNCGIDPIHPDYYIPMNEIETDLRLKCTSTGIQLIHLVMSEEMNEAVSKMKELENIQEVDAQKTDSKKCRRTKERRIGYIIDKVWKWREYYNVIPFLSKGVIENGTFHRYTLDDAAKKVGISKKSLDDYLLQVRYGKKNGFNFNEHKNEKVGVLRAFVKKFNTQKKKRNKQE